MIDPNPKTIMASERMIKLVNERFPKVIELVENGRTIAEALAKSGLNRGKFYEAISPAQKAELQLVKTAHAEKGVRWNSKMKQQPQL